MNLNNTLILLKKHIKKESILSEKDWDIIFKETNCVVDNRGQWDHPGKCTLINSKRITMKGVNYDVLGIDENGFYKVMNPEMEYNFSGKKVFEIPLVDDWLYLVDKLLN